MPDHIASAAPVLEVVRGATAFVRTGRLTSANSRASSDAASGGRPHFFLLALMPPRWIAAIS